MSKKNKNMDKNSKVFVAGHRGLVGSAIVRALEREGYSNIITRTRRQLDLEDAQAVADFFKKEKPEFVFDAAARVGGIMANKEHPAEFIYQNLAVQNNIIHNAYLSGVKKLLFLGSVCIYPKFAEEPVREDSLLSGSLEPTNKAYAIAKIAGIVMCQSYNQQYGTNFVSVMPTNLYGPGDNFDLKSSHVLPALIRKFHEAKVRGEKSVTLWGTGSPRREFMHSDDMASACLFVMDNHDGSEIINIGAGSDITIKEVAEMLKEITGFPGSIDWDTTRPDGTPRRLLDNSRLTKLGWKPKIALRDGLVSAYEWFKENEADKK
jgi:GDP-L-fucose synthase